MDYANIMKLIKPTNEDQFIWKTYIEDKIGLIALNPLNQICQINFLVIIIGLYLVILAVV